MACSSLPGLNFAVRDERVNERPYTQLSFAVSLHLSQGIFLVVVICLTIQVRVDPYLGLGGS